MYVCVAVIYGTSVNLNSPQPAFSFLSFPQDQKIEILTKTLSSLDCDISPVSSYFHEQGMESKYSAACWDGRALFVNIFK